MPDFMDIKNPVIGKNSRSLEAQFSKDLGSLPIPFADLSDGEKCFVISAIVLAANAAYGPLVCSWDDPDNYLAMSEVGHFIMALRKAFQTGDLPARSIRTNPKAGLRVAILTRSVFPDGVFSPFGVMWLTVTNMRTKAKRRVDETRGGSFVARTKAAEGDCDLPGLKTATRLSLFAPTGSALPRPNRGHREVREGSPPGL